MRNESTLQKTALAQMTPDEFASYVIVVGVEPVADPSAPRRITVPAEEAEAFDRLRAEISRCVPLMRRGLDAAARQSLESRCVMAIMDIDLAANGDCCFGRIPGGNRPFLLTLRSQQKRHGARQIIEQAHRDEIHQAIGRGESVSEEACAQYRIRTPLRQSHPQPSTQAFA